MKTMPNLSKPITLLATLNIFVIAGGLLAIGLVLFLMSQSHNFVIPFAPFVVLIVSSIISAWLANYVYMSLHSKVNSVSPSVQKVLLVLLVIITAGVLYGVVSSL